MKFLLGSDIRPSGRHFWHLDPTMSDLGSTFLGSRRRSLGNEWQLLRNAPCPGCASFGGLREIVWGMPEAQLDRERFGLNDTYPVLASILAFTALIALFTKSLK